MEAGRLGSLEAGRLGSLEAIKLRRWERKWEGGRRKGEKTEVEKMRSWEGGRRR